jgi:hypothetical protein
MPSASACITGGMRLLTARMPSVALVLGPPALSGSAWRCTGGCGLGCRWRCAVASESGDAGLLSLAVLSSRHCLRAVDTAVRDAFALAHSVLLPSVLEDEGSTAVLVLAGSVHLGAGDVVEELEGTVLGKVRETDAG